MVQRALVVEQAEEQRRSFEVGAHDHGGEIGIAFGARLVAQLADDADDRVRQNGQVIDEAREGARVHEIESVKARFGTDLLYARVDMLRDDAGAPVLLDQYADGSHVPFPP